MPINYDEHYGSGEDATNRRKEVIWATYFSGGAGVEHYFGGQDLSLQDFRAHATLWAYTRHARELVAALPFCPPTSRKAEGRQVRMAVPIGPRPRSLSAQVTRTVCRYPAS